uniref:Light-independent protochlorophyllide reductase subunit B n=1 Tax=Cyanoptyche gloeocystis TaxID=77922 RepID=A0A3G1IW99_9EUKA|nr:photochlorophyllide reductase subunit B [Cyanoptyche gloeocystis]
MKLAYWMYAGPAHIGTLRIVSSFKNVHAIMHAPLGDDYFNVMRSMLERERNFTPVTTSVVDRHVLARGSQDKIVNNINRKDKEETPDLIVLTPTCTSSILQEDLENFVERASMESTADVLLADVNHYRVNELEAADRTLEQIVRFYLEKAKKENQLCLEKTEKPSVNIIGITNLGFHHQHDCRELKKLFADLDIQINVIMPETAAVTDLKYLTRAWFNIIPYREIGLLTAQYLKKEYGMSYIDINPIGLIETVRFLTTIQKCLNQSINCIESKDLVLNNIQIFLKNTWFNNDYNKQICNPIGKKTIVFGSSTHAASLTKILTKEMGIHVLCSGTYCVYDKDWFFEQVLHFCNKILITEDHTKIGDFIAKSEPNAILGTQMERHLGKRLNIPCGVISAPVHIQNFPLSYKPFIGFEGIKHICDLIYNCFTFGISHSLLSIFEQKQINTTKINQINENIDLIWDIEAQNELKKIPGFVRGRIQRNIEILAREKNINLINVEVLYALKEIVADN